MTAYKFATVAAAIAVGSAFTVNAQAPQQPQQAQQQQGAAKSEIDKNADELFRQMSDYLSGLKGFSMHASVVDEVVTVPNTFPPASM